MPSRAKAAASRWFEGAETLVYVALGVLLMLTTLLGIASATSSFVTALLASGAPNGIVVTIDRLLFVFMLVEILHTVRMSFRSGELLCEPFLIVGLIASIRRVLVITLKSAEPATPPHGPIDARLPELLVLGALILILVGSIVLLRRTPQTD